MATPPKFMRFPFAATGDKEAIPDEAQASGSLSYSEGFGLDYERDPTKDAKAKRMPRDGTNQVLFDATSNIQQYQLYGVPYWYDATNNGGTAIQYQKNAKVRYSDGSNENIYISLKDNNTDIPTVEASWFLFQPYNLTLLSRLSVAPFVPIESMALTIPPVTPVQGKAYLVPTNATSLWADKAGQLAEWNGSKWTFLQTNDGHCIGLPDGRVFTKVDGTYIEKIALDSQSGKWSYADAQGSANALTAKLDPKPLALTTGMVIQLKIAITNTGATTLNLNGFGPKPILNFEFLPLKAGELPAGLIAILIYDGANFICTNSNAIKNWVDNQIISRTPKLMRLGTITVPATGITFAASRVTFDIAFPARCTGITITPNNVVNPEGWAGIPYAKVVSRSQFDVVIDTNGTKNVTTPVVCSYIAIGE